MITHLFKERLLTEKVLGKTYTYSNIKFPDDRYSKNSSLNILKYD